MSEQYAKLKCSIIHSTIWDQENHIRIVWITMLAMKDSEGYVGSSIPGLANASRVSIKECEEALEYLKSPDPYSRSKEHEGRRIVERDGGWVLLNHEKHRGESYKDRERERKKKWAAENKVNTKKSIKAHSGATIAHSALNSANSANSADPDPDSDPYSVKTPNNILEGEKESKSKVDYRNETHEDVDHDVPKDVVPDSEVESPNGQVVEQEPVLMSTRIIALLEELWPDLDVISAEAYYMKIRSVYPDIDADKLESIIRKAWAKWPHGRTIFEAGIGVWIIREIDMVLKDEKREAERQEYFESRKAERDGTDGSGKKVSVHKSLERLEADLIAGQKQGSMVTLKMDSVRDTINETVEDGIPLPVIVKTWLDTGARNGAFELATGRKLISSYRPNGTPKEIIKKPPPPMTQEEIRKQVSKAMVMKNPTPSSDAPESTQSPDQQHGEQVSDEISEEDYAMLAVAREKARQVQRERGDGITPVSDMIGDALGVRKVGEK